MVWYRAIIFNMRLPLQCRSALPAASAVVGHLVAFLDAGSSDDLGILVAVARGLLLANDWSLSSDMWDRCLLRFKKLSSMCLRALAVHRYDGGFWLGWVTAWLWLFISVLL